MNISYYNSWISSLQQNLFHRKCPPNLKPFNIYAKKKQTFDFRLLISRTKANSYFYFDRSTPIHDSVVRHFHFAILKKKNLSRINKSKSINRLKYTTHNSHLSLLFPLDFINFPKINIIMQKYRKVSAKESENLAFLHSFVERNAPRFFLLIDR